MSEDTEEPSEKPKLKDARQNPWYVLMTVAGEQEHADIYYDSALHNRNRYYWNRWIASTLSHEQRVELVDSGRVASTEVEDLTAEDWQQINSALEARCPNAELPNPGPFEKNLDGLTFDIPLILNGFIFPPDFTASDAEFRRPVQIAKSTFIGDFTSSNTIFMKFLHARGVYIFGNFFYRKVFLKKRPILEEVSFMEIFKFQGLGSLKRRL